MATRRSPPSSPLSLKQNSTARTSSSPPRPAQAKPLLSASPWLATCSPGQTASRNPIRRWPSSSRQPANLPNRSPANWNGSTPSPAPAWPPASAAWTCARSAARLPAVRTSSSARPVACQTISVAAHWMPRTSALSCWTRPTKCSTWASARNSNTFSKARRKPAVR